MKKVIIIIFGLLLIATIILLSGMAKKPVVDDILSSERINEIRLIKKEKLSFNPKTENNEIPIKSYSSDYGGIIETTNSGSLKLRLIDRKANTLWEKNARSLLALIWGNRNSCRIINIGKKYGEGYISQGKVIYMGFTIYDIKGNIIRKNDNDYIYQIRPLLNGNIILGNRSQLWALDKEGNELWRVSTNFSEFYINGDFIITEFMNSKSDKRESYIYTKDGNLLTGFEDSNFSHIRIMGCSSNAKYICVARLHATLPPIWKLYIYHLDKNKNILIDSFNAPQVPIAATLTNDGNYVVILSDPGNWKLYYTSKQGEVIDSYNLEDHKGFNIRGECDITMNVDNILRLIAHNDIFYFKL